ncbi:hypothetical protein BH20VER1_BH20VER1_04810 [soil metagenome]
MHRSATHIHKPDSVVQGRVAERACSAINFVENGARGNTARWAAAG